MECSRCGDFVLYDLSDDTEEVLCEDCREELGKSTDQLGTEVEMGMEPEAEEGSSGDTSLTQAQRAKLAALTMVSGIITFFMALSLSMNTVQYGLMTAHRPRNGLALTLIVLNIALIAGAAYMMKRKNAKQQETANQPQEQT